MGGYSNIRLRQLVDSRECRPLEALPASDSEADQPRDRHREMFGPLVVDQMDQTAGLGSFFESLHIISINHVHHPNYTHHARRVGSRVLPISFSACSMVFSLAPLQIETSHDIHSWMTRRVFDSGIRNSLSSSLNIPLICCSRCLLDLNSKSNAFADLKRLISLLYRNTCISSVVSRSALRYVVSSSRVNLFLGLASP
jgi:hypothetical protein